MKKFITACLLAITMFCSPPTRLFYCDTPRDIKEFKSVYGVKIVRIDTLQNWCTKSYIVRYIDTVKIK